MNDKITVELTREQLENAARAAAILFAEQLENAETINSADAIAGYMESAEEARQLYNVFARAAGRRKIEAAENYDSTVIRFEYAD